MTLQDILRLIDAGYTRQEIEQLNRDESAAEPAAAEPAAEPAEPVADSVDQESKTPSGPDPSAELETVRNELKTTQQQLQDLIKQMQQNNLRTASVNVLPQENLETATDAAMAELIRPTIKEEAGRK